MNTYLLYIGRFSGISGISDAALGYIDAAAAAGIKVLMCDINTGVSVGRVPPGIDFSSKGGIAEISGGDKDRIIVLFHDVPTELNRLDYEGLVRLIAFTVNETVEYPTHWAKRLMDAHEVWTASDFNVENISQVIPPFMVSKFPHVYTSGFRTFAMRQIARNEPLPASRPLNFLTVCSALERRQLRRFAEAFAALRADGEDVTFTIKTRYGSASEVKAALGGTERYQGAVVIDEIDLTRTGMYDYYGRFDGFVNTEWGRGWDLPGFSCLALNKIYVAPAFGGNLDFMDNANSVKIDVDFFEHVSGEPIANTSLYNGYRGGFSSMDSVRSALKDAIALARKGADPNVARGLLEKFAPDAIGALMNGHLAKLEEFDFYQNGAPKVKVTSKAATKAAKAAAVTSAKLEVSTGAGGQPTYAMATPQRTIAERVHYTLKGWPMAHSVARKFYQRVLK